MENCLHTKFKREVSNDNLEILGEFVIHYDSKTAGTYAAAKRLFQMARNATNQNLKVRVTGDGYFTVGNSSEHLTSYEINTGSSGAYFDFRFSEGAYDICIGNKYNLDVIAVSWEWEDYPFYFNTSVFNKCDKLRTIKFKSGYLTGDIKNVSLPIIRDICLSGSDTVISNISGNVSSLSQCTTLETLDIKRTKVSGTLSSLANLTRLTQVVISETSISGTLSDLANLKKLTTLTIPSTSIIGSLEAFANAQVSAGRTSGTCAIRCNGAVTYNGNIISNYTVKTVKYGSSMVNPTAEETTQGWQV